MRTHLHTCSCCHATYQADARASRRLVCDAPYCRLTRQVWRKARQTAATRARRDRQRPRPVPIPVLAPPEPTTPRDCLRCSARFDSIGAHHRVCDTCKGSGPWMDPASHVPIYW